MKSERVFGTMHSDLELRSLIWQKWPLAPAEILLRANSNQQFTSSQ
jgi:hypothetical protein